MGDEKEPWQEISDKIVEAISGQKRSVMIRALNHAYARVIGTAANTKDEALKLLPKVGDDIREEVITNYKTHGDRK